MGRCAGHSPRNFIVVVRAFVFRHTAVRAPRKTKFCVGAPGTFGFRHPGEGRDPVRTNVSTCVADSKCLARAGRVPNSLRGKSSLSLGLGTALRRYDGARAGIKEKEKNMKKFLFILFGVFVVAGAFAAGENVPTSKGYVDAAVATKQDIIPANDGVTRVLTNTGTAGEYDTRGIYDANGAYAAQTQNLVDAATMNAGVQNAIDSEFQCIEWLDPNDHSSDCLLLQIGNQNLFRPEMITNTARLINNGDGSFTCTAEPTNSVVGTGKKLSEC